jgi:ABC-type Zn uptake system ZnuABC Zn-binding protein ZnuA
MTSRWAAVSLAAALAAGVVGCGRLDSVWPPRASKPVRVLVTIPPLDSFVKNVAGDRAEVRCLCTDKGPHHYEYDVQDTNQFRDADLFFAVGLTLDDKFADQLAAHSRNPRLRYVKLGDRLPENLKLPLDTDHEAREEHAAGHRHEHGETDPHVWMGIAQARGMVEAIRDELKRLDPGSGSEYEANAAKYAEALDRVLADGKARLAEKKDRKIISFHESLAYFAKSFGIRVVGTIEKGPGDEPGAGHLAGLIDLCKKENVRVIAVEPQYPKTTSARILLKELRDKGHEAKLVEIDPLETADADKLKDPKWYEERIRHDVEELAKALP